MNNNNLDSSSVGYTPKSILTTEIINSIGHELKTPLTSIKGFSQLMKKNSALNSSEIICYSDIIDKNADRLYDTIIDLVTFLEYNKSYLDEIEKNTQKKQ